jgi:hypothetical protein
MAAWGPACQPVGAASDVPAKRPSPETSDSAILQAVLAKVGPGVCVAATLGYLPFADLRSRIAEAPSPEAHPQAGRAAIVRAAMGHWMDDKASVAPGLAARLLAAATAIVERDHRLPLATDGNRADGAAIPQGALAPGQSLGTRPDCTSVTVSEVARHGTLAFVDVGIVHAPLAGSGERWALELSTGTWKVIARQLLWVS